jgi:hypothetical protein
MPQRFRLLRGKHIQEDLSAEPMTQFDEESGKDEPVMVRGADRKLRKRYPAKTYSKGEEFDSPIDLVKRFGPEKFEYVDSPRKRKGSPGLSGENEEVVEASEKTLEDFSERGQTHAPHGQVSTGFQATSGGTPGPLSPEKAHLVPSDEQVESLTVGEPKRQSGLKEQKGAKTQKEFAREDLKKMPKKELEELAAENEIDIEGAHTKDEIIEKFNPRK